MGKKPILLLTALIFIIGVVFLWSEIYLPLNQSSNEIIDFNIQKGQGAKAISIGLRNQGLIKHPSIFRFYTSLLGKAKKLQIGTYELSPAMNIDDMLGKFIKGDVKKEKITIIEGWNLKDIAQYFEEKGICNKEEFFNLVEKDFNQDFNFLNDKPIGADLEGYLFPDTYKIIPGTAVGEVIKKVLSNFDRKLSSELRQEIARQGKSIFEVITMASLIEREVRTLEDKKLVSGIFWKRLKLGIPLQSCATVVYITGKKSTEVLTEDTKIDSPYNTYKYRGLPLGPISNPGLDSIVAAIYPTESDYLYFLSTPDGTTIFSKTFAEHNKARAKYGI
ncbi:endolytic transglycosylase MltG [Patescibacteria group bacterium]|nr:endolytic transglycosylase MltG [Patescibacteria group bacterium]